MAGQMQQTAFLLLGIDIYSALIFFGLIFYSSPNSLIHHQIFNE